MKDTSWGVADRLADACPGVTDPNHRTGPSGYLARADWGDNMMKTHRQGAVSRLQAVGRLDPASLAPSGRVAQWSGRLTRRAEPVILGYMNNKRIEQLKAAKARRDARAEVREQDRRDLSHEKEKVTGPSGRSA